MEKRPRKPTRPAKPTRILSPSPTPVEVALFADMPVLVTKLSRELDAVLDAVQLLTNRCAALEDCCEDLEDRLDRQAIAYEDLQDENTRLHRELLDLHTAYMENNTLLTLVRTKAHQARA